MSIETSLFHEPEDGEFAGRLTVKSISSPYQRYMQLQGIPIYEGPGFYDARELDLGRWDRRGVNGAFLVLDQLAHLTGIYVIEVPARAMTEPEKHIYEEKFFVVEGDGSTELWSDGDHRRFEWHAGSLFSIPVNTSYQIVNATSKPVRLLSGNTAPTSINTFDDLDFVFNSNFVFRDRYDGSEDYFSPNTETLATPELGRAMWRTNLIPDLARCELPVDNVRAPGYRRIELPRMGSGNFWGFVGEYPSGRYSKAHAHGSGAALVCIRGKGFTYTWPSSLGTTPWADGHGDRVERVDYVPGGMVAAAPGSGDWFHQHFGVAKEPLRLLVFHGGLAGGPYRSYGGRKGKRVSGKNIEEGGNAISYATEDPHIRDEYRRMLALEGVALDMAEVS